LTSISRPINALPNVVNVILSHIKRQNSEMVKRNAFKPMVAHNTIHMMDINANKILPKLSLILPIRPPYAKYH
jgi:hypothetical protein